MSNKFNETLAQAIAVALDEGGSHEKQVDTVYELVNVEAGFLVSREDLEDSLKMVTIYEMYRKG